MTSSVDATQWEYPVAIVGANGQDFNHLDIELTPRGADGVSISVTLIFLNTMNCIGSCTDMHCVRGFGFDDGLELETGFGQAVIEVAVDSSESCG